MTANPQTSQQLQRARDIEALKKLWVSGMPSVPVPENSQWELWFDIHRNDFGTLAYGLEQCARLFNQRRGHMDLDHCIKHSSKVMNRYRLDRARRGKPIQHFPLNILSKDLADAVGLPAGIALTEKMFWTIHARALAIRQGRIPAPSKPNEGSDAAKTTKAA
jgi:hypothetical protein